MLTTEKGRLIPITALAIVLGAFAWPTAAETYKWIDANGTVNYSNTRPSSPRTTKLEVVGEGQLSVVEVPKPSEEDVRALNERLLERRISQLEQALAERRTSSPSSIDADYLEPPIYYTGSGYLPYEPDERYGKRRGPRYEIKPGPYGVGAQAVPIPRRQPRAGMSNGVPNGAAPKSP